MNASRARPSPACIRCMRRWASCWRRARSIEVAGPATVDVCPIKAEPYPWSRGIPAPAPAQPSYLGQRPVEASALGRQHEDLERPDGVEHDLAVVPDDLAAGQLLDRAGGRLAHDLLEGQAVLAHEVLVARGQERLLVARQAAFEHDEDVVVLDVGLRPLGPAPVVALLEADHRVGHGGA